METPQVPKVLKKTRVRKSPETPEEIPDDMCLSKMQAIKVKKVCFLNNIFHYDTVLQCFTYDDNSILICCTTSGENH